MLLIMFGISLAIIMASAIRRPVLPWQKGVLLLAVIMLLAVCVAWGIEYFLQRARNGCFRLRQFVLFLFSAISAMFGAVNIQFGQLRKDLQRPSDLLPEDAYFLNTATNCVICALSFTQTPLSPILAR